MRVTDKMIFESARRESMSARERVDAAVWQTSTGRRISHPSEDPAASGLVSSGRLSVERLDAIRKSTGMAQDDLQSMHTAFQTVSDLVVNARTLAVQLANDSNSAADRAASASEVDGFFRTIIGAMNAQVGDRYVFSGSEDKTASFDNLGNYQGDTTIRQIEIAPGVFENVAVRSDTAIKGVGGGVDILTSLSDFATALRNNDVPGIEAALAALTTGHGQIAAALAEVSNQANVFISAESVNLAARDDVGSQVSRLADADIMASSTELALANRALEASIAASAKSFSHSLLDWLK